MDNPEYTFQILEMFSKIKPQEIPKELEEYISYVARTGDPVFQWSMVKVLIKEKLLSVLDEFTEGNVNMDIPPCPNVDPFNFDVTKNVLLHQLDNFILPPFTIQRICELLASPRKEYNRVDKYMRAVEKNVLVVSANDLSLKSGVDADNSDAVINGILYDKVNDSLNISNHVFSGEENDGESSISSKLDETDAVQQMIEESWNEENHNEYKINGAADTSLSDYDLDFVNDKKNDSKNTSCDSKGNESFDSNSMLMDSSLQNIIDEGSSITFESVPKPEDSFIPKNDTTYEFKDDSHNEIFESKNNLTYKLNDSHSEIDNPALDENNADHLTQLNYSVNSTIESAIELSSHIKEPDEEKLKTCEFLYLDSRNIESLRESQSDLVKEDFSMEIESTGKAQNTVESTTSDEILSSVSVVDDEASSKPTTNEAEAPVESSTKIEVKTHSCGDSVELPSSSNSESTIEQTKESEPVINE